MNGMTVAQLVSVLQTFDQGLPVLIDGCDCHAEATAVTLDDGQVKITRKDCEDLYPIGSLVRGEVSS